MGAVTYPDQDVIEFLAEQFVPFKVNVKDLDSGGRALVAKHRTIWEPGLLYLDARGREVRRNVGFLPPTEFIADSRVALGKIALLQSRYADAEQQFRQAVDLSSEGGVAPEALYWAGIAAFRIAGNKKLELAERWAELQERFPGSSWWSRADVFLESDLTP